MFEYEQTPSYRDPDTFDVRTSLRHVVQATKEQKLVVAITCAAVLVLATLYVIIFPSTYVATARVMVERPVDNSRDAFYTTWDVFRKEDPKTEKELMTAPGILAEVVKKENLKYEDVYHPMSSHLSYLWRESLPGRAYHKVKEVIFPKKPDPDAPTPQEIEFARTVNDMGAGIKIVPVADSDIGELTLKGPSRRVADMANDLLNAYLAKRTQRFEDEAKDNLEALDKQVDLASRQAQEVALKRQQFLVDNHLNFDLSQESQELTKLVDLEDQIAANRAKAASLEASLQLVEQQLAQEPATKNSSNTTEVNPIRESAKLKRLDLETGLISLRSTYREDSPEVQEVLKNIASLDALIAKEPETVAKISTSTLNSIRQDLIMSRNTLSSQLDGIKGGLKVMEATDSTVRARMSKVPELQTELRDYDRQYSLISDRYQALSAKRAQAAVSLAIAQSAAPSMQVVQWATKPDDIAWPKLKIVFPSALFFGLLLGVIGAQFRSMMRGRVHRSDWENGRAATPLYGTLHISPGTPPFKVVGRRGSAVR